MTAPPGEELARLAALHGVGTSYHPSPDRTVTASAAAVTRALAALGVGQRGFAGQRGFGAGSFGAGRLRRTFGVGRCGHGGLLGGYSVGYVGYRRPTQRAR